MQTEQVAGRGGAPASRGRGGHAQAVRDNWAAFLGSFPLDTFFTLTFSPEYAEKHFVYSHTSALNQFQRWVKEIGYPGQYFVASEEHFDRDTPHLHGLMQSLDVPLRNYWFDWFKDRGRAKLEPPRSDAAAIYCAKYCLKDRDSDSYRFDLKRFSRGRA